MDDDPDQKIKYVLLKSLCISKDTKVWAPLLNTLFINMDIIIHIVSIFRNKRPCATNCSF